METIPEEEPEAADPLGPPPNVETAQSRRRDRDHSGGGSGGRRPAGPAAQRGPAGYRLEINVDDAIEDVLELALADQDGPLLPEDFDLVSRRLLMMLMGHDRLDCTRRCADALEQVIAICQGRSRAEMRSWSTHIFMMLKRSNTATFEDLCSCCLETAALASAHAREEDDARAAEQRRPGAAAAATGCATQDPRLGPSGPPEDRRAAEDVRGRRSSRTDPGEPTPGAVRAAPGPWAHKHIFGPQGAAEVEGTVASAVAAAAGRAASPAASPAAGRERSACRRPSIER